MLDDWPPGIIPSGKRSPRPPPPSPHPLSGGGDKLVLSGGRAWLGCARGMGGRGKLNFSCIRCLGIVSPSTPCPRRTWASFSPAALLNPATSNPSHLSLGCDPFPTPSLSALSNSGPHPFSPGLAQQHPDWSAASFLHPLVCYVLESQSGGLTTQIRSHQQTPLPISFPPFEWIPIFLPSSQIELASPFMTCPLLKL